MPALVGRSGDHADALTVAQSLGRDGLPRLAVEHHDEVGGGRQHPPVRFRDEVLVLELQSERGAPVSVDPCPTTGEAGRRGPVHVGDLAAEQLAAAEELHDSGDGVGLRLAGPRDPLTDVDAPGQRSRHQRLPRGGARHREAGDHDGAAHLDARDAGDALGPGVVGGLQHPRVPLLIAEREGGRRHAVQRGEHHLQFGERAPHAVRIDERKPERRCGGDRDRRVHPADLGTGDVRDRAAEVDTERLDRFDDLREARQLLHHDGGRAHHRDEQHEGVVRHLVERHDRDVSGGEGLAGEECTDVRVAAPAGAEHGCAAGETVDVGGGDRRVHVRLPCRGRRRPSRGCAWRCREDTGWGPRRSR